MMIRFVIPNRDDPEKPPVLYDDWNAEAVPREGESVYLNGTGWRVKSVMHEFQTADRDRLTHCIHVRLIEPDHWTQR